MTAPRWRAAIEEAAHHPLPRTRIGDRPVVVKHVSYREVAVHRLVHRTMPDVVPPVLAAWPADNHDSWVMVLPDLTPTTQPPAGELLRAGLERLALVHSAFAAVADLDGLDLGGPPGAAAFADRLARRDAEWTLSLGPGRLRSWERLESTLPKWRDALAADRTLVHGDLHAGNVLPAADGGVWLIDWSAACLLSPAWDLSTCDKGLVGAYLAARAARGHPLDVPAFSRQLRAAAVVRLHRAVSELIEDRPRLEIPHELTVEAVRRCVDRAVRAHETPGFLGG